ncbi:DMT family transporter [Criblamydia sequanensis]|uniref:Small multidrug resistance protein n=1 Tax=Candidatus Criblamydia sequanensis CRIB-18 TaxID=1437425 RepID=A0A090D231_9BACT|nr:multidrug efflux SMR transporter [Criblamydia sequanensis]CDR34028.1 Small multidrug resistance protein [Criblamydia sequanensis CRIB-18]
MAYFFLLIAMLFEIMATSSLNLSHGFTRFIPSIISILGYAISFYFLSLTLLTIPVGVAYAIWSGVGIVLISVIGFFAFGQRLDLAAIIGISFIIAGVLIIHLLSGTASHTQG